MSVNLLSNISVLNESPFSIKPVEKERSLSRDFAAYGCRHHALKSFVHRLTDLPLSHLNTVKHSKAIVGFKQTKMHAQLTVLYPEESF